ncbi:MAG: CoA ester lyase [Desulfobacterales bacterium]|nr:CoA ester lyase [Desulfobacterales bacterium]
MKPLRTALFSPGNRPDRVEKAIGSGADAVIIDLEDAVPLSEKENTRPLVRAILDRHPGKRLYVRVNGLTTPYCTEDLAAVVCNNLTGILFPKVESQEDIFEIDRILFDAEKRSGLEKGIIEIMTLCESAKGLEEIYPIVSAKPKHHQFSTVAFGSADYTLDLGIALTREGKELEYARARIPIACRAAGIMPPIDTPWMVDLKDIDGLVADAKKAKAYGFQGKLVIHPNQIQPCHDVFTPTEEEIAKAKKIIDAFEEAERQGRAAIQLEGKFIDYAVVEKAKRIYALAQAIIEKS